MLRSELRKEIVLHRQYDMCPAWDIKVRAPDTDGKFLGHNPALDDAWDEYVQAHPELWYLACENKLYQYLIEPDEGVTFEQRGRSGGHLVLTNFYDFSFGAEYVEDVIRGAGRYDLWALYNYLNKLDRQIKPYFAMRQQYYDFRIDWEISRAVKEQA